MPLTDRVEKKQPSTRDGNRLRGSERISQGNIDKLASVVHAKYSREIIFIGWDADDKPTVTNDLSCLSDEARNVYEVYRRKVSGYNIPTIPFSDLLPFKLNFLDSLVDAPPRREDIFSLSVTTPEGKQRNIKVGEQELLEAISAANNPFLDTSPEAISGKRVVKSESLYTLIIGGYNADIPDDTGVALLFRSVEGNEQELSFRIFIEEVLGNLIANDLQQDSAGRKGYAQAAMAYLSRDTNKELPNSPIARLFYKSRQDQEQAGQSLHKLFYGDTAKGPQLEINLDLDKLQSLEMSVLFKIIAEFSAVAKKYFGPRR